MESHSLESVLGWSSCSSECSPNELTVDDLLRLYRRAYVHATNVLRIVIFAANVLKM